MVGLRRGPWLRCAVLAGIGAAAALGRAVPAPDPVSVGGSVVCAFGLAEEGPVAAVILLEGIPRGLTGFAVFCLGVAVPLPRLRAVTAFVSATAATGAAPADPALSGRCGPGRSGPSAPG